MSDLFIRSFLHFIFPFSLSSSTRCNFCLYSKEKKRNQVRIEGGRKKDCQCRKKSVLKLKIFFYFSYFKIAYGDLAVFHISFRDYHFSFVLWYILFRKQLRLFALSPSFLCSRFLFSFYFLYPFEL